ncbi:MAG: Ig-like domain-containing protein [Rhodospirillaceae bacterium]
MTAGYSNNSSKTGLVIAGVLLVLILGIGGAYFAGVFDGEAPTGPIAGDQPAPVEPSQPAVGTTTAPAPPTATTAEATAPAAQPEPQAEPEAASTEAAEPAQADDPIAPAFDIVRVEQDGNAVIAGRAEPGARVQVLDDGEVVGEAIADARGEWVVLPDDPLKPGDRAMTLQATAPDGTPLGESPPVVMSIPERESEAPVIVLAEPEPGEASRLLQGPSGEEGSEDLSIATVDYDDQGRLALGGQAPEGTTVRTYLDNEPIGEAQSSSDNTWDLVVPEPVEPGTYTLRADRIAPDGTVEARIEIPFLRPSSLPVPEDGGIMFVVQPGNNLWTLARNLYGDGLRYTTIYQANTNQIRDPDLIYPGQIFTLPREAASPAGG